MQVEVTFKGSFPSLSKMPAGNLPQFAFIGRSNVGKSSLINMLTDHRKLAKVSKQPGKTQLINLFEVDEKWVLVDLPGYGYAKESKKKRKSWEVMVNTYLKEAPMLQLAFVLIDSNIPPQQKDLDFINWLGTQGIPFSLVFTKTDRLVPRKTAKNVEAFCEALLEEWESLPPHFLASSVSKAGRDEILSYIVSLES